MNVLFLCTGNTCRSPMAEALFLRLAEDLGLRGITAGSAGLSVPFPEPVSENAAAALSELGISLLKERSRSLSEEDLAADLFFVMTRAHENALLSLGVSRERIFLPKRSVSDPFGGDLSVYRQCRDELSAAVRDFLRFAMKPEILPMTAESARDAAEIERQSFCTPWSLESLLEEVSSPTARFFTLSVFGRTAAYAGMHVVLDEAYIDNIAVLPELRGFGLGRKITDHLISCAAAVPCSFITLEVRASNKAALHLYESCGFLPAGRRPGYYSNPTEDALLYTLRLKGENNEDTWN